MVMLYLPKNFGPMDHLKAAEAVGRKSGKPVGSYIGDLVDLKKTILLCDSCCKGFNPEANHYIQHKAIAKVRGKCDACREFSNTCNCYSPDPSR